MALNSVKEESRVSSATVVNNQGLTDSLLKEIRSMHSKHEGVNHTEAADAKNIVPTTNCSQPWWRGTDCNAGSPAVLVEDTSKSSSMEEKDSKLGTNASESQVEGSPNERDGVTKETNMTSQSGSDGQYGHEHPNLQHVASTLPLTGGEYLIPRAQLELVGHSIACAQHPYSDPYYAGMMTPFGTQAPVHPQLLGMRHTRMPLPLEMAEEPVYVNAKQYHGILRRRQSRAKAELERKLIKSRKPYLHESRHQHAMRRARGCGGRFLNTKKLDNDAANHTLESARLSDSNRNQNSSGGQNMQESNSYSNKDGKGCYQHNQNLPLQSYHSHSSERGEEGDCSGQQRGSIPVNQAPNRALAIQ